MASTQPTAMDKTPLFLARERLQQLIDVLKDAGFHCVGPKLRDGAIVYEAIGSASDLPAGVHDEQEAGRYRVRKSASPRAFAWANGPQALKPLLFAPREVLWRAKRKADGGLEFLPDQPQGKPVAVIGVRACDLAALAIQDQHFMQHAHGACSDPCYAARRENMFLVAVNCSHPASTCFCVSTGDGPRAATGFDIALDELDEGFVLACASPRAWELVEALGLPPATAYEIEETWQQTEKAERSMSRRLPGRNLRDALFANLQHPRWEDVANRCLSCGNCTSVCPTCFCHNERDQEQLDGSESTHFREWDSCFTRGHSYIHGLTVRADTRTRYRQWLTHKLGSWHDQFGRSGCVGCGRCITWCPVGIDITEEAMAICGDKP